MQQKPEQPQVLRLSIPPEIHALAEKQKLGALHLNPGPARMPTADKAVTAMFAIIGGVFFVILGIGFMSGSDSSSAGTCLGLFFLLAGFFIAGMPLYAASGANERKYSHVHAYIFESGLIYIDKEQVTHIARWNQIDKVWCSVVQVRRNGVHVRTHHKYTVHCHNRQQFIIDDKLSGAELVGDRICTRVTEVQLPLAFQAYQQGEIVAFGPLSISQQGIDNGRDLLPWTQVKDVSIKDGFVSVKRENGWFRWTTEAALKIPNVFVFIALTNHILKQHGKK